MRLPELRIRTLMVAVGLSHPAPAARSNLPVPAGRTIELWPYKIPLWWFTTTRPLLVMVAILGVLLGAGVGAAKMLRRAEAYDAIAGRHLGASVYYRLAAQYGTLEPVCHFELTEPPGTPAQIAEWKRLSAYHLRLSRKYKYAARRPWLSVPPDPLEPK